MKSSRLETKFARLWREIGGPPLRRELKFHPTRKWPFDFAHPATRTAIEIQGGVYGAGRKCPACHQRRALGHNTGAGVLRDYEKLNEAQLLGWTVFQLAPQMICRTWLERIRQHIEELS